MDVNTAYGITGNIKNHGENVELQNLQRYHNSVQQVALNERSTADQYMYITMNRAVICNPGTNGKGIEVICYERRHNYVPV